MPWGNMRGWEILIIALLILLLFGAKRLPDLSRSVARSLKIFRTEVKAPVKDTDTPADAAGSAPGTSSTAEPAAQAPPDPGETPAPSSDSEQKRA